MRLRLFILFILLFCPVLLTNTAGAAARSEAIAVVVNDDVVTRSSLEDRLKLILVSAGLPDNQETRAQLLPQVVGALVDEQIRMQDVEKAGLSVSQEEIDQGFARIAQQNNFTPEQFKTAIARGGVNIATLYRQIEAQLAWAKMVQERLRPRVSISDSDVDAWLERARNAKGKSESLVSEIFLPVDRAGEEARVRELATRLVRDIRARKVSFFKVAQQFSKAAGAAQGGDLGWIQQGQFPEELDTALENMDANNVSDPVRSLSGFHIFLVRNKRLISDETIPDRQTVRNIIGLERLERLQQRYFFDLKSTAFIENRLEPPS